jgi:CBS domain protein
MAVMTAKAVRHLPVLESGRLVGIVSIGDMVKSVISDQKFIIEQLEHFIHGDRWAADARAYSKVRRRKMRAQPHSAKDKPKGWVPLLAQSRQLRSLAGCPLMTQSGHQPHSFNVDSLVLSPAIRKSTRWYLAAPGLAFIAASAKLFPG